MKMLTEMESLNYKVGTLINKAIDEHRNPHLDEEVQDYLRQMQLATVDEWLAYNQHLADRARRGGLAN